MTPIETAARAICELDGHPANATMGGWPLWHDYRAEVRAVLMAVREPSAEMADAGRFAASQCGPVQCWQVMLDMALAEG